MSTRSRVISIASHIAFAACMAPPSAAHGATEWVRVDENGDKVEGWTPVSIYIGGDAVGQSSLGEDSNATAVGNLAGGLDSITARIRLRFLSVSSDPGALTGSVGDFGRAVLNSTPETAQFSLEIRTINWYSHGYPERHDGGLGFHPYLALSTGTWSANNADDPESLTGNVTTLSAGLPLSFYLDARRLMPEQRDFLIGFALGPALKANIGDVAYARQALGDVRPLFAGAEGQVRLQIADIEGYTRVTWLPDSEDSEVLGLTGFQAVIGVRILGKFVRIQAPDRTPARI